MANKTLTPRQRMINMMYLVLIALLALNVSREILKSFHLFELSFINANRTVDVRNAEKMKDFQARVDNERTKRKAEKWYLLAKETQKISAEFNLYVDKVKADIIAKGGGRIEAQKGETGPTELSKPDDMEEHAYYFTDEGLGNGKKLQDRINATREKLIALLSTVNNSKNIMASIGKSTQLRAVDPKTNSVEKKTWVSAYLENAPLAGVVTLLTKTQNDCKSLEADILSILNENINITSLTPTGQTAVIIPDSRYVMSGTSFTARVALATFDNMTPQKIFVNGKEIQMVNGFGQYTVPATGAGTHQMAASIESVNPLTGEVIQVDATPVQWNSFMPGATISADAMNVLFIGLENPVSISVPGITAENTIVTANNGIAMQKDGSGKYIAKVAEGKNTGKIFVSARMDDGSVKSMGEMEYKIRKVPTPKLRLGNLAPGVYEKSMLLAQPFIYAYLEDFYFNNVKFKVTKYRLSLVSKSGKGDKEIRVSSNSTSEAKSLIGSARSGDFLWFDEIEATGPNGKIRLESISMKIK